MPRRRHRRGRRSRRNTKPVVNEPEVTENLSGIVIIAHQHCTELSHLEAVCVLGRQWTENSMATQNPTIKFLPGSFTDAATVLKQVVGNGLSSRFRHTKDILPVNRTVVASRIRIVSALTEILEALSSPPPSYIIRVIHSNPEKSDIIMATIRDLITRMFPQSQEDNIAARMLVAVTSSASTSFITVMKNPHRYNMMRLSSEGAAVCAPVVAPAPLAVVQPPPSSGHQEAPPPQVESVREAAVCAPVVAPAEPAVVQALPDSGHQEAPPPQIETVRETDIQMENVNSFTFYWTMPLNSIDQEAGELQADGPALMEVITILQQNLKTDIQMENVNSFNFYWKVPLNSVVQEDGQLQADGPALMEVIPFQQENQKVRATLGNDKFTVSRRRITI